MLPCCTSDLKRRKPKVTASTSKSSEVLRVRKQDQKQREEQESLLNLYLQAVKGAARAAKAA